ncbi:MAG: two-component system, NtrC family, response regulator AtoC [Desulfuromonadales bacterium]|nr:two-component system, NtrC family, response regulator AtoC [Desulfuromonadales bacterium]
MSESRTAGRMLIVDDDPAFCELLEEILAGQGHRVWNGRNVAAARDVLQREEIDVVLTDLNMPGEGGIDFCAELHANRPDLPVVIMTAFGSLETAIAALRAGAYDFVTKPVDFDLLGFCLERALQHRQLQEKIRLLKVQVDSQQAGDNLIGESQAMQMIREQIGRLADLDTSILISGESGTGKELVARALHRLSRRSKGPFVAINCAALPESLLESELFGHVRGAFTDAREDHRGLFAEASGGTLFLDEIGELPLALQPKLLRVLEERKVRPLGGEREIACDVRILTATHCDLAEAVREGRFRSDLYYRLNVIQLKLPPLRARENDILLLAHNFITELARRFGKSVTGLAEPAARRLLLYSWPGNVRELRNVIERAVALTGHDRITVQDLPDHLQKPGTEPPITSTPSDPLSLLPLAEMERRYIAQVLEQVGGNRTLAARILGVDRKTLYRKLKDD